MYETLTNGFESKVYVDMTSYTDSKYTMYVIWTRLILYTIPNFFPMKMFDATNFVNWTNNIRAIYMPLEMRMEIIMYNSLFPK